MALRTGIAKVVPNLALPTVVFDAFEDAYKIRFNQDAGKLFKRRCALVGAPGAFFPSTQYRLLPEYLTLKNEIKALAKVELIYFLCVNDPFVLREFAEEIDGEESVVFIADFEGKVAGAVGALKEFQEVGLRSKAFSCIVEDSRISHLEVEEDWRVSKTSRAYHFLNRLSPYIPYPGTLYAN